MSKRRRRQAQPASQPVGKVVWVLPRSRDLTVSYRRDKRHYRRVAAARYQVDYNLAYDGGGSRYSIYYRYLWVARLDMIYRHYIQSWGGSSTLYDLRAD